MQARPRASLEELIVALIYRFLAFSMTEMERLFRHAPGGEYKPNNILMPSTKEQLLEKLRSLIGMVAKYPTYPPTLAHLKRLRTNLTILECHGADGHIDFLRRYLESLYEISAIVEFFYRRSDLLPASEQSVCEER